MLEWSSSFLLTSIAFAAWRRRHCEWWGETTENVWRCSDAQASEKFLHHQGQQWQPFAYAISALSCQQRESGILIPGWGCLLFVYQRNTLKAIRSSFNTCPCFPDRNGICQGWEDKGCYPLAHKTQGLFDFPVNLTPGGLPGLGKNDSNKCLSEETNYRGNPNIWSYFMGEDQKDSDVSNKDGSS